MNKPLYTLSYTLATAGAAGLLFSGIYTLVDIYGYRRPTVAMEWMGMHALMIYVLIACNILPIFIHGFYWKEPKNNLVSFDRCCNLSFQPDFQLLTQLKVGTQPVLSTWTRPVLSTSNELDLMVLCCSWSSSELEHEVMNWWRYTNTDII